MHRASRLILACDTSRHRSKNRERFRVERIHFQQSPSLGNFQWQIFRSFNKHRQCSTEENRARFSFITSHCFPFERGFRRRRYSVTALIIKPLIECLSNSARAFSLECSSSGHFFTSKSMNSYPLLRCVFFGVRPRVDRPRSTLKRSSFEES